jgi:tryptophanyl-tRNA synthetase
MFKKQQKKILLSGVKPTGRVHIGNYFGAMKQFIDLQHEYESYIFIADYHALTTVQDKVEMEKGILDVALDYLAIGLDPKRVVLFQTKRCASSDRACLDL